MKNSLAGAVFTIAPEREAEFDTTLEDFDLIYLNQRQWVFCADPKAWEIFVSRGAVELIWCASLAHFLFYSQLIQGKRFDRPTEIDPNSNERVRISLNLLRWAINCQKEKDSSDGWPPNLPCPLESSPKESVENVADEICLVSCAFILHHEFAHIRLRHNAGERGGWSLSQEKEADIAAAEWVLDCVDVGNPMFAKRMLGIVQALLVTTAVGLYGGNLGGTTHPFSYDRLSSLLNRFLGDSNHVITAIAFAVLDLHFQNSGRRLQKQQFNDFGETLEAICDQLAEEFQTKNDFTS